MIGRTNVKVKPNKKKSLINYVEYLESTGTQYIDTEINADNKLSLVIDMQLTNLNETQYFGVIKSNGSNSYTRHHFTAYASDIQYHTNTQGNSILTSNLTERHLFNIDIYNKKITVDDATTKNLTFSDFDTGLNYWLFKRNSNSSSLQISIKMRIYSCKMYYEGALVRDFKPVKDGTGVYCLYDEIEKRYFYNQGTGSFSGGASL